MTSPVASSPTPPARVALWRHLRPLAWVLSGVLLGGVALAALPFGGAPVAPPPTASDAAEQAAIRTLRARLRNADAAEFRMVRVYRSGAADERAVCGQIVSADLPGGAAEFAARVILRGTERPGTLPLVVLEEGPGVLRASADAQRRYCRDAPPPAAAPPPDASPLLSARLPGDSMTGAGDRAVPTEGGGPRGRAAVQSPANLRTGPGGGAVVLSTLPRGQALTVFERAPGGWLQVGDDAPWGWVHSSLVAEHHP